VSHVRLRSPFPGCWPKLFCVWPWTERKAADHEAGVVLGQVAFRIKVAHAGLGGHPTIDEVGGRLDARAVLVVGLPLAVAVGGVMKAGRRISNDKRS
jgi:hypothetical protein